jgi:hypothetical protein
MVVRRKNVAKDASSKNSDRKLEIRHRDDKVLPKRVNEGSKCSKL